MSFEKSRNNIPILGMLLIFCIDLLLIITTHLNWNNAMSKYLPLKSEIQVFKNDMTIGHLWFEEAISGDKSIDLEKDVMYKFRHENFILYVQRTKEVLSSKDDFKYYKKLEMLLIKSNEFYNLANIRLENVLNHGIGSDLDQIFDLKFKELINIIDSLNTEIDYRLSKEFKDRNTYFKYILILFLILNIFIFLLLYITRKKKIEYENKLFEEKEKAEITLKSIGDAVIVTNKKAEIEFLNPIAEKLTGFTLTEAKGKLIDEIFKIFNSSTKEEVTTPIKKVLEEGIIVGLANGTGLRSKDGSIYIIEDSAAPIKNKKEEIIGAVLVFHDVTGQEKIREQLQLNEKMLILQSKQASMGDMLENIAHQWRQPLSAITTAASGMKVEKEFDKLDDENFYKNIDAIINNSNNLSKTLDNFRDFFKPNNEKVLLNLNDIINNALNILSSKIENNNIKVIKNCENIVMKSFSSELLQIFVIFLSNSIEAFSKNKKEKLIFIDTSRRDTDILIIVKDNANGVEEGILERIFEPYFTTKHKSQGKGIGLFMVTEIITKHMNGEVLASNKTFSYKHKSYKGLELVIKLKNRK